MELHTLNKLISMVSDCAIYIQKDSEGMRIQSYDILDDLKDEMELEDLCFYCEGEETGDYYRIPYAEIDVKTDMFYRLKLVDFDDY